jgi:hypothetical protein
MVWPGGGLRWVALGPALIAAVCGGPSGSASGDQAGDAGPSRARGLVVAQAPPRATEGDADWILTGPAFGEVRRPAAFRVALSDAVHPRGPVRFTASASDADGHFEPAVVELSDAVRSATIAYTPTRWGKRTIAVADDGGLRGPRSMLEFVAKVQVGASGTAPSGNRGPDLGGFDFFARGGWWRELGRPVVDDPVAPDSDALLAGFGAGRIRVDWETTTAHGGNSNYGIPYNVVSGDQPPVPLALNPRSKESDPGPVPFFAGMSIELWKEPNGGPPTSARIRDGGDHHALVARRDEATGGIDRLYEYYQVASDDGGRSWKCLSAGGQFDLRTGAPRPEFWTSSDAGGLPMLPLLVRYDEAARGEIRHPFRVCISPGLSRNRFVWPARHAVYSGSPQKGLPMGARLRLKRSWYEANRGSFSPINRAIIDAMRVYGVIVADLAGGGLWLNGVNDERWDHNDLMKLRAVPASAFEVVDTIKPPVRVKGPAAGRVGVPYRFTIQHVVAEDSVFASSVYINAVSDGGKRLPVTRVTIDDRHRGPFSFSFTAPAAGTYSLRVDYGGKEWREPPDHVFVASGSMARRASPGAERTAPRPHSLGPARP